MKDQGRAKAKKKASVRYLAWGEYLRSKRSVSFRSARSFCEGLEVNISYPHYSRFESGEQLPELDVALVIGRKLEIPVSELMMQWCAAQLADDLQSLNELKQVFQYEDGAQTSIAKKVKKEDVLVEAVSPVTPVRLPIDEVIVFNRSHLKVFRSDPLYRDLFTYVNSFMPEWISIEEITEALKIDEARALRMAEELQDLGVLQMNEDRCRTVKRTFYFPDDADFFELRNRNILNDVTSVLNQLTANDLSEGKGYRALLTRELTESQLNAVIQKLDETLHWAVQLDQTTGADSIYSICALVGRRFSRNDRFKK